jgi:DNA processing protein
MTDLEATALAVLGHPRRRLLGALVRHWLARPIPEVDDLPERDPVEPLLAWACRCARAHGAGSDLDHLTTTAAELLAGAARAGQRAVSIASAAYPRALREIPDPPPVLWLRGQLEPLHAPRLVAVVGARAASRQGLDVAAALGAGLASAGVVVVSGLARGVDTAAHRAALAAGGRSVAVLGSGVDRVYPREHARLADELAERGAVLSELAPGTPPLAFHFPLRNRLISGLSAATVVVEASEKSGSLITAGAALEQGREVMAVPGPVATGRHRGAHALLRDGATLVERADDVVAALGWGAPVAPGPAGSGRLDPLVAAELGLDPATDDFDADDVSAATGWPPARVCARLGALEIAGRIQRVGGGRFVGSANRVVT